MTTYYVSGNGSDSNDGLSSGAPKATIAGIPNTGGVFTGGNTTIYFEAGTTITNTSGSTWSVSSGATLTLRAYGGGTRPLINCSGSGSGFKTTGSGSLLDAQDIQLIKAATTATAIDAQGGGSLRASNVKVSGWGMGIRGGSETILVEDCEVLQPLRSCIFVEALAANPSAVNGIIRRNTCAGATPSIGDPIVLHGGGYGLSTGWIIEDNSTIFLNPDTETETGIDTQEQFRGTIVRRNYCSGSASWGLTQGKLFYDNNSTRAFNTLTQMLARFNRQGVAGTGPETIKAGDIAFVTADGANNGIYLLSGNNPSVIGGWTGPMTATEFSDLSHTLIYENVFESNPAGILIRHPGTEFVANRVISDLAYNEAIKLDDTAYDIKAWDNVFQSTNGGAANTENLLRVEALDSNIAQRLRLTIKNNVFRQRLNHTGALISLGSSNDLGYITSDYNAFIADEGVSDAAWPNFATAGGNKTFSEWKTANSGSDAHSLWQTPETALIDENSRPLDSSTFIDAGTARSGLDGSIPATDVEGNAVTVPPEIGAYRYVSESAQAAVVPTPRRTLRAPRTAGVAPPPIVTPGDITGLINDSLTAVSATMSWDVDAASSYYELRTSISGSDTWTTFGTTFSDISGTITGLTAGISYDVQVRGSVTSELYGNWSTSVTIDVPPAVWFLPQDSSNHAGFSVMPTLTEKFMQTGITSNASAYVTPGWYTLPTDNGGAGGGVALIAVDDNSDRRMNVVLSMVGMTSGRHWLIAGKYSHVNSGTDDLQFFDYGAHSTLSSMYAVQVNVAGLLGFQRRGLAGSQTTTVLTNTSGPTAFSDFDGEGEYTVLTSIRAVSTTSVDVEVRIIHSTLGTSVWTGSNLDCTTGGDVATLPGITAGQTAAEHGGLMIGARMRSVTADYTPERLFGRGASNVGTIGTFQARVHSTYDSARIDAAEAAIESDPTGWWLA